MKKVFMCGSHLCNHGGCLTIRREDVHVLLWPPKKPLIRCSILPSWSAYTKLLERLQGVWPKIIFVAMEMPIFYVNFSSLNYPNLNDESLGPYGWFYKNAQSLVLMYGKKFIKSMVSLKISILQIWVHIQEVNSADNQLPTLTLLLGCSYQSLIEWLHVMSQGARLSLILMVQSCKFFKVILEAQVSVLQGSVLSPVLSLLVMDPLLRELEHNSLGPSVYGTYAGAFAHADDIRTVTSSLPSL